MELMLPLSIPPLPDPIRYGQKLLLVGSCFTEHIGDALARVKFDVMQNPHGILFGPDSVCHCLRSCLHDVPAGRNDLFQLGEVWHSWHHHSRFSHTDPEEVLVRIDRSRTDGHSYLLKADWLILTLGSSFSYRLTERASTASLCPGDAVANCHRAPSDWFEKRLLETHEIIRDLEDTVRAIRDRNPGIRIIFTISPVRHIRDGVVENNRSKARLIEAVHYLCARLSGSYYFPAYELVIDVLRDHRFYDIDLVHPNFAATRYVMERFAAACIDPSARPIMEEVEKIVAARQHRPFLPETHAHRDFRASLLARVDALQRRYPYLDLDKERRYFSGEGQEAPF